MSNFWTNKKVTVTGGNGFLGKYVVQKLKEHGAKQINIADIDRYDLRILADIKQIYEEQQLNIVIHLAAVVGGIGANHQNPGKFFYDNAVMGIQLIEQARLFGIVKLVCVGTIYAYPKYTPVPFKEDDLWNGYPEETNAHYGLAKKMLLFQLQAYRQQYGFNGICLLPVNLYGPGDNFEPESSHVIPALIKKCMAAKREGKQEIVVWGTGEVSREFIYVENAAEGIVLAIEKYNKPEPVNIGTGFEIKIKDLVQLIVKLTGFSGKIIWDKTKPDGQPRRMLDTYRAKQDFGFEASVNFEQGLQRTTDWHKEVIG